MNSEKHLFFGRKEEKGREGGREGVIRMLIIHIWEERNGKGGKGRGEEGGEERREEGALNHKDIHSTLCWKHLPKVSASPVLPARHGLGTEKMWYENPKEQIGDSCVL